MSGKKKSSEEEKHSVSVNEILSETEEGEKISSEGEEGAAANTNPCSWNWRLLRYEKPSDPYEELLNDMIQRTSGGEIIAFDEFLDAMDELSEEPDEPQPTEAEIREAAAAKERILSEMRRFELPIENRLLLSTALYEKALKEPSQALLRLICYMLCDSNLLWNPNPEDRSPEDDVNEWKTMRRGAAILYADLSARKRMSVQFGELLERLKQFRFSSVLKKPTDNPEKEAIAREIAEIYIQNFPHKGKAPQLADNIFLLLTIADDNPDLAAIKPLFLYRVLTRHGKRLQSASDLRLDFKALWKYQSYKIDDDNGKNYRTYAQYMFLFETLYGLFETDETVDAPLCLYGFGHLSNLTDFYRRFYPEEEQTIPFSLSVEELWLKLEHTFSRLECGYGKCVVLEENGISLRKLSGILSSKDKAFQKAFEKIEGYLNANAAELLRIHPEIKYTF